MKYLFALLLLVPMAALSQEEASETDTTNASQPVAACSSTPYRQYWEASTDDDATWSVLFDGLYVEQSETP